MYKRARALTSHYVAQLLRNWHQKQSRSGTWPSISAATWARTPIGARKWLRQRVLKPLETDAHQAATGNKQLSEVLSDNLSGWALSPATLAYLSHFVEKHKPRCILEFGSGVSTKLFAVYAREMSQQNQPVTVCSLEHDRDWLRQTQEQLRISGLLDFVSLFEAQLATQQFVGKSILTYEIPQTCVEMLGSTAGVELLLIDGPPRRVGRSGCLPVAVPLLADNATILLDDAFRPEELDAMATWFTSLKGKLSQPRLLLLDSHGTGLMAWDVQADRL